MYIPAQHRVTDRQELIQFIRTHSFATLITSGSGTDAPPEATHLPLLLVEDNSTSDGGLRLTGHFARANPHWKHATAQPVRAIFHGPHAFISAAWYAERNVVPTWNYVAVHVVGRLTYIENPVELRELLDQMVQAYEHQRAEPHLEGTPQTTDRPWATETVTPEYLASMMNAIVGFSIEVQEIEGKWKLNQHHSEDRKIRTIASLRDRGMPDDLAIADLMEATLLR
ncbi:MAG: FMN-binding negative transcriptional regulator [Planctomyces sp.]|nr:FMN-binding negative transcriptional regulator [Planctomyces sp.]